MKVFKKSLAAAAAAIIAFSNICSAGSQPLIGNMNAVNAAIISDRVVSDRMEYDDVLYYVKVDEDKDGTFDYVEITGYCDYTYEELQIPSKIEGLPVKSIGDMAFHMHSYLKSITIPDSVTKIGVRAFQNCRSLTNVTIPDSVTEIGGGAFMGTALHAHQTGVKYADKWVVDCDLDITEVKIKSGTKGIANAAFSSCKKLTDVEIPDSITEIGENAFYYCPSLENINVSKNNNNYISVDNVLFNKEKTKLIRYPSGRTGLEYIIPDSVTEIGDGAFFDCGSLTSVTIKNPECIIYGEGNTICNGAYNDYIPYYNGVIRGYKGSTAQEYAEKYDYKFEAIGENPPVTTVPPTTADPTTTTTIKTTTANPVTTKTVTTKPVTTKSVTTNSVTTKSVTTNSVTTKSVTTNSVTTKSVTTNSVTTKPVTTNPVTTAPVVTTKPIVLGDVNGNDDIDLYDAIEIAKSLIGKRTFTDEEKKIADFNQDGYINLYDAIDIAKALLKKNKKN